MQAHRIDRLPMDRRVASVSGGPALPALYERRDVEPGASVLQRRSGSVRSTASVPICWVRLATGA